MSDWIGWQLLYAATPTLIGLTVLTLGCPSLAAPTGAKVVVDKAGDARLHVENLKNETCSVNGTSIDTGASATFLATDSTATAFHDALKHGIRCIDNENNKTFLNVAFAPITPAPTLLSLTRATSDPVEWHPSAAWQAVKGVVGTYVGCTVEGEAANQCTAQATGSGSYRVDFTGKVPEAFVLKFEKLNLKVTRGTCDFSMADNLPGLIPGASYQAIRFVPNTRESCALPTRFRLKLKDADLTFNVVDGNPDVHAVTALPATLAVGSAIAEILSASGTRLGGAAVRVSERPKVRDGLVHVVMPDGADWASHARKDVAWAAVGGPGITNRVVLDFGFEARVAQAGPGTSWYIASNGDLKVTGSASNTAALQFKNGGTLSFEVTRPRATPIAVTADLHETIGQEKGRQLASVPLTLAARVEPPKLPFSPRTVFFVACHETALPPGGRIGTDELESTRENVESARSELCGGNSVGCEQLSSELASLTTKSSNRDTDTATSPVIRRLDSTRDKIIAADNRLTALINTLDPTLRGKRLLADALDGCYQAREIAAGLPAPPSGPKQQGVVRNMARLERALNELWRTCAEAKVLHDDYVRAMFKKAGATVVRDGERSAVEADAIESGSCRLYADFEQVPLPSRWLGAHTVKIEVSYKNGATSVPTTVDWLLDPSHQVKTAGGFASTKLPMPPSGSISTAGLFTVTVRLEKPQSTDPLSGELATIYAETFEARLNPRDAFAWSILPIRTFITVPVELTGIRTPASPREFRTSDPQVRAQLVTPRIGLLLGVEPWDYDLNENPTPVNVRVLTGVHLYASDREETDVGFSFVHGFGFALPIIEKDQIGTAAEMSFFWEYDLRERFVDGHRFLVTAGFNFFEFLGSSPEGGAD